MKPILITTKTNAILGKNEERMNELHRYLRSDGRKAIIEDSLKLLANVPDYVQAVYFKPTTMIPDATVKPEGVGKIIDFRFG